MPKVQIGNENLAAAVKSSKQGFKLPAEDVDQIKKKLEKYKVSSFQQLFDYLVVSGVIFLKREILDLVKEECEAFRKHKKSKNGEGIKTRPVYVLMYPTDYQAFNRFCVEEEVKKFWVIRALMKLFIEENKVIIDHIKDCQSRKVTERKKQIVRLLKDEYIDVLPETDADKLLDSFTEKYDNKKYGDSIQEELNKYLAQKVKVEQREEEDEAEALEVKQERIRQARKVMRRVLTPRT